MAFPQGRGGPPHRGLPRLDLPGGGELPLQGALTLPDFLLDGPEDAPLLLLAPGAGAGHASPGMTAIAAALAAAGLRIARWDFAFRTSPRSIPPRAETLVPEVAAALDALAAPGRIAIGGKSMGGRVASLAADALHEAGRITGLLCLGYPFHPPNRPDRPRTAHLAGLRTPALIVQGTRDPFGTPPEVAAYSLSPAIEIHWVEDGDHDLKPRKRVTGLSHADALAAVAARAAAWCRRLAA